MQYDVDTPDAYFAALEDGTLEYSWVYVAPSQVSTSR